MVAMACMAWQVRLPPVCRLRLNARPRTDQPLGHGMLRAQLKAYTTRVGAGPYPTEVFEGLAEELREIGREYGTTTGRPRRIGWLDIPAAKYAVS